MQRLLIESMSFTIISIRSQHDTLIVSGLKELLILTVLSNGTVGQKLHLTPTLDASNYIVKVRKCILMNNNYYNWRLCGVRVYAEYLHW